MVRGVGLGAGAGVTGRRTAGRATRATVHRWIGYTAAWGADGGCGAVGLLIAWAPDTDGLTAATLTCTCAPYERALAATVRWYY